MGEELKQVGRTELILSHILRISVVLSLFIVIEGLVVMFIHHPSYLHSAADLKRLQTPGAAFPHTLPDLGHEWSRGSGRAITAIGLILLICTPILRVAASIVAFVVQRDWIFVFITGAVLTVLLTAFLTSGVLS